MSDFATVAAAVAAALADEATWTGINASETDWPAPPPVIAPDDSTTTLPAGQDVVILTPANTLTVEYGGATILLNGLGLYLSATTPLRLQTLIRSVIRVVDWVIEANAPLGIRWEPARLWPPRTHPLVATLGITWREVIALSTYTPPEP